MSDGTAWINIGDATSYVYVSDTTGITNAESSMAKTLVNEFDAKAVPLELKARTTQQTLMSIIDDINNIDPSDYTPASVMDAFTKSALNSAYSKTAWLSAPDGLKQINSISAQSSLLSNAKLPKYGDLGRVTENFRGGMVDIVSDEIDNVASDVANQFGKTIQEQAIGKRLSNLTNPGYLKSDKIFTQNTEPVSTVIDSGKGFSSKSTSKISNMNTELITLDDITNSTDQIGGSSYTSEVDEMIDRAQDMFDRMFISDDPALPTYGEFDVNSFLDSISVPTLVKDNIKKSLNLNNKAKNNANLVVDKAVETAKQGQKSTSSLDSNTENQTVEEKRQSAEENSIVETTTGAVPAAPGRNAEPSVTTEAPAPEVVPIPEKPSEPVDEPAEKVSFKSLVDEKEFIDFDGSYATLDPGGSGIPDILEKAYGIIPDGLSSTPEKRMRIKVEVSGIATSVETAENNQLWNKVSYQTVSVGYERIDGGGAVRENSFQGYIFGKKVDADEHKELTTEQKRKAASQTVKAALSTMIDGNIGNVELFKSIFGAGFFEDF